MVSTGADDLSRENEVIVVAVARVSRFVDERSHNVQAEPASRPRRCRLIEIGQGAGQRVEWSAVIAEFDLQLPDVEGEGDLDPASGVPKVVPMFDVVGEQFLENDQQPGALGAGQGETTCEPLGKANEPAELGGIAAQAERCSHPTSIKDRPTSDRTQSGIFQASFLRRKGGELTRRRPLVRTAAAYAVSTPLSVEEWPSG